MKQFKQTHKKWASIVAVAAAVAGLSLPLQAQQDPGTTGAGAAGSTGQSSSGQGSYGQGAAGQGQQGGTTQHFIMGAQISSQFQSQAAQLASQKAQNPQLKQFAQQVQQQNSQNQQQLQSLAQKQGMSEKEPLPQRMSQELQNLDQQSGKEFDQAVATDLLRQNARSLRYTDRTMSQIQDPQVKQFAQTFAQQQQQQLQQAAQVARNVGVDQETINSALSQVPQSMGGTGASEGQGGGGGPSGNQQNQGGTGSQSGGQGGTSSQPENQGGTGQHP